MSNYTLPTIKIIDVQKNIDSIVTKIAIVDKKEYFGKSIDPAWISKGEYPNWYKFELHKLISFKQDVLVFETYLLDSKLPIAGEKYQFCSSFMPSQIKLIQDTSKKWVKKKYTKYLCSCDLALWGDINEEGEYGYTDGEHWITIADFEKYIKSDILRIRNI